ncbi:MAG: potassium channel family protein [Candidatus Limnocylindrales bacterium]
MSGTTAPSRPAGARSPSGITARHVRIWLALVVGIVFLATAGYMLLLGWSAWDALYMTVNTLTTVGFREVQPLDNVGRAWTMAVAVAGVGIIFGTVGIVAEFVVSEVASGRREARRMEQEVAALHDHFVLCGYGRVGSTVARELRHGGRAVVVVDVVAESIERARADEFLVVEGDATQDATLKAAGVERAAGLITTLDTDAHNVYVILSARALNERLVIVGRANTHEAEAKLTRAGANRVVSPYDMAGHRLAELAIRPRITDYLDAALSHRRLEFGLEELAVPSGGRLDGATVDALRQEGVLVLAIAHESGEYEAVPPAKRALAAGETLILSGTGEALARLRAHP